MLTRPASKNDAMSAPCVQLSCWTNSGAAKGLSRFHPQCSGQVFYLVWQSQQPRLGLPLQNSPNGSRTQALKSHSATSKMFAGRHACRAAVPRTHTSSPAELPLMMRFSLGGAVDHVSPGLQEPNQTPTCEGSKKSVGGVLPFACEHES